MPIPRFSDSLSSRSQLPYEIYANEMRQISRGYALLNPRPYSTAERTDPPVRVGDVGFVVDGQWRTLFNIHLPPEEQSKGHIVPDPFEHFPRPDMWKSYEGPNQFYPSSNTSFTVNFNINAPSTAAQESSYTFRFRTMASIAFAGRCESYRADSHRYNEYAMRNAAHWEALVEREGLDVDVKKLVLVYQCTLAPVWATGIYQTNNLNVPGAPQINIDEIASAMPFLHPMNDSPPEFKYDYGPEGRLKPITFPSTAEYSEIAPDARVSLQDISFNFPGSHHLGDTPFDSDQCLFLDGVRVADLPRANDRNERTGFGFGQLAYRPDDYDSDQGCILTRTDSDGSDEYDEPEGLLDGLVDKAKASVARRRLMEYIVENSDAEVPFVFDSDLGPYLEEINEGLDIMDILLEKRPQVYTISVESEVVGSLQPLPDDLFNDPSSFFLQDD